MWFLYDNRLRHERVKRQPHKMLKHTQTIRRQQRVWPACLSVFDHFVGLALKGYVILKKVCNIHISVFCGEIKWNDSS